MPSDTIHIPLPENEATHGLFKAKRTKDMPLARANPAGQKKAEN